MIPNQWYAILESNEVKAGQRIGVTRMGEKLVAWRSSSGALSVMSDLCPHRGVALSTGAVLGDCLQCPFHGFEFDASGKCTLIPSNGRSADLPKAMRVKSYPAREAHGLIYIWWGEERAADEYPPLPFFEAIDDRMVYTTLRDPWHTHYSRAIENQLDVMHLPFVHRTTIGRGNRTLVNGPLVRVEHFFPQDNLINLWVYNEVDAGQKPKRASELPEPTRRPFLQFRYPNIWHNWISDDFRVFVAFAPIDDEHTMMYLRNYHRTTTPGLQQIAGFFGALGNLVIERQDKPVVETQRPKASGLSIGEKLVPGDGAIITYRKIRQALQEGRPGIEE
jgi:phenylpropionate dioxygenase-like ring-hydroxylating dioxygenase large terminal subunit